jgi:3-hydroxymyristoyl/3-hydroxydecanoyl-(acyl carrier protein) dehydratase
MPNIEWGKSQIEHVLPHRGRALLLDKVKIVEDGTIFGYHTVTDKDCEGHFPGNPIYPGVLRIEQIAQTLGIGGVNTLIEGELPYFVGAEKLRFPGIARQGDLVRTEATISRQSARYIKGSGRAFVGEILVAEVEDILCLIGK